MKPRNWVILASLLLVFARPAPAAGSHYVFAHYMVCYSDYGQSIAGYEHDIQDAQAAGVDGFALNLGAYDDPTQTYYNTNVALIYAAAEQLGTGFKLFFSVDGITNTNVIIDLVSTYAGRTNSFRYNGKLVLSTYTDNGANWQNGVLSPLANMGIKVFFVPNFLPTQWSSNSVAALLSEYPFMDGLFNFAVYTVANITNSNQADLQGCQGAGRLFMAGYSPTYWGCYQYGASGRGYCETDGGEGTITQWQWIIANQPDWVEIVTWNDFNESTYSSPINDPMQYETGFTPPYRYCHAGYLALAQHYITWYKTGSEPAINQDSLYYFYRTHSTNCVASDTNDTQIIFWPNNGPYREDLFTTTFLTSPAQLVINSGGTLTTNVLAAGISSQRTPFKPGAQTFTLLRAGTSPMTVQGPNILASITNYDYFTASGSATRPLAPANLRVQNGQN